MSRLALPEHVPDIVRVTLRTPHGADREGLEKAVVLALQSIPDPDQRTAMLLAGSDPESDAQRIEVLPLLGRVGGGRVLDLVQAALASPRGDIYEAGVRAIANWPDAGVVEQLAILARDARESHQRIRALRDDSRQCLAGRYAGRSKISVAQTCDGTGGPRRRTALALHRASAIRTVDALRFVVPHLDDPGLSPAACYAVVELAHHKELRDPNRDAFAPALQKVIAVCSDAGLVDRAKRYLRELNE